MQRHLTLLLLGILGCGDSGNGSLIGDGSVGGDGPWTPSGDGSPLVVLDGGIVITEDGGATIVCYATMCNGHLTECGDCQDNDKDGFVDWRDRECLGPCDNTEGPALESGVGGVGGNTCKVDCYFDFGNGPGNDVCLWDHRCDPLQPESTLCPYNSGLVGSKDCPATQSTLCSEICRPLTPNGCDCFGCCTFPQLAGRGPGGGPGYVWIGALDEKTNTGTCTFDGILDPAKCPACTPIENCLNTCERCEVCLGQPMPPADCYSIDAGAPQQCPTNVQPCGLPGQAQCPAGTYCITGCCQPMIE